MNLRKKEKIREKDRNLPLVCPIPVRHDILFQKKRFEKDDEEDNEGNNEENSLTTLNIKLKLSGEMATGRFF